MSNKRNELCSCGSELKYKKCCLNKSSNSSEVEFALNSINFEHDKKDLIVSSFISLGEHVTSKNMMGACHLISVMFHILLKEQGIESKLCIGEVKDKNGKSRFDHSWVEINERIFDIAIQKTIDGSINSPIFADFEMDTLNKTKFKYNTGTKNLDAEAKRVYDTPIVDYMDNPELTKIFGEWAGIDIVAKDLGLDVKTEDLKLKYFDLKRILV